MKLSRIYLLPLFLLVFAGLKAQAPAQLIQFEESTHDFGELTQGDPTETVFKFKNISQEKVRLTNVKASCGCTTPVWTKDEIAPGGSGEIKVTYNSSRIGPFNKSVRVQYNDREDAVTVFIQGKVNAKPQELGMEPNLPTNTGNRPSSTINYSNPRGALAFEKVVESIPTLSSEEVRDVEFRFKNISSTPVKILKEKSVIDKGLSLVFKDDVLQPGQESFARIKVSGPEVKSQGQVDGYFSKRVIIYTDEAEGANKQLSVNANFKRVFSDAEVANSPKIVFETTSIENVKIIEGEKYELLFKFKNEGKGPLKILSAKPSCGCTAVAPLEEEIAPGGEGVIKAVFDSNGRTGLQSKTITVQSNDVVTPVVGLRFTVEVVKDPFHAGSN